MRSEYGHFNSSIIFMAFGIAAAFAIGLFDSGSITHAFSMAFACIILGVLEISLSFDNAIVNASVLKKMTPRWRERFLTWGMFFSVFIMRLLFPLFIVAATAQINPWTTLKLAATQPAAYARIMNTAHLPVAAFGGSFLLLVALRFFINTKRNVHWLGGLERGLAKLGKFRGLDLAIGLLAVLVSSKLFDDIDAMTILVAGMCGVLVFIAIDTLSAFLEHRGLDPKEASNIFRANISLFVYLEVLDAAFSFDGVVGAFAITQNLFIICIGLSIGAMFVRSLTILLVDRGTLTRYRFLEHGAFYAIFALSIVMFISMKTKVPEAITGLVGAGCIGLSLHFSIRHNNRRSRKSNSN